MFTIHLIQLLCGLAFIVGISSGDFNVNMNLDKASFKVDINGNTWMDSGPIMFRANTKTYRTDDGSLKMYATPSVDDGRDPIGKWQMANFSFLADKNRVHATIASYYDVPAVIFTQYFQDGMEKTTVGDMNGIISGFPSFKIPSQGSTNLGYLVYGDLMCGWTQLKTGNFSQGMPQLPDGLKSGPVVIFDEQDNVLIISPISKFMAASYVHNKQEGTLSWGIMGDVDEIPAHYSYSTIVFYSDQGINKAMEDWGVLMRRYYRRTQDARHSDISVKYIGYYTDNGAYYYHKTEGKMNYEDTVLGGYDYSKYLSIPYRYLQYDDWFYPIRGTGYGATVTWDAMPSVFPHGLLYLYNITKLPVVAHNRYWSNMTTYAKQNGGKYDFIMDGENSLPVDQKFWDDLFAWAKQWGLVVYEQDWLNFQVENIKALHRDPLLGNQWLRQMGNAATKYGLQIQYCMALPREVLFAVEIPAVSHVRVSGDYVQGNNWKIGISSMLADAVGLAPYKDTFWTTQEQPGNSYGRKEVNPFREAVVALLSTGPVGPGDKIGYTDPKLLARLHTSDGTLLKPSKPAFAINQEIQEMAFQKGTGPIGEVWSTYCNINEWKFGIILVSDLQQDYRLTRSASGLRNFDNNLVVLPMIPTGGSTDAVAISEFSDNRPLPIPSTACGKDSICVYYVSPSFYWNSNYIVILGDLSKVVPMSPQRVFSIDLGSSDLQVILTGSPGEKVPFSVWFNNSVRTTMCIIGDTATALYSLANGACN